MGMLGTERRSELAIIGNPANLSSRLQEFTKVAIQSAEGKNTLGDFAAAMGVCQPELSEGMKGFRQVTLPASIRIRDFENIEELTVITA